METNEFKRAQKGEISKIIQLFGFQSRIYKNLIGIHKTIIQNPLKYFSLISISISKGLLRVFSISKVKVSVFKKRN
jgi:hypothetical protein